MTRDGRYVRYGRDIDSDKEAMQEKIKGHSNIVVLVKTKENKIFGGYTSSKIEYKDTWRIDNKAFLFSIDLNEKFNIKENRWAIDDSNNYGIRFGYNDLVLFNGKWNECYSCFGWKRSFYETNEITRDEFCGGKIHGRITNYFQPMEI